MEETCDYIYINGSASLESLLEAANCVFHKEEGHLKLITLQKYYVLLESLCCAFGLVAQTLMPDAVNY